MDPAGFISALGDESSKNQHTVVVEFTEDTVIHFVGCYGFLLIGLILQLSGSITEQINCINSQSPVDNGLSRETVAYVNNFCWMAENENGQNFVEFENPELDARWYVDHLSKIFFLISICFHIPKIAWSLSVGGILNSYMGYTRLLLDIVKQKLESIPKDGIWGGTQKYHPGRAFDPDSKLFSQRQKYEPLRMSSFLQNVGEGAASLEDMLEGSDTSSVKETQTSCLCSSSKKKTAKSDVEDPLMDQSESFCCLGNRCKNVCKMNDRALVGKLMYRNFSHMNVVPLIVSIHKVTYIQDAATSHHQVLYDGKNDPHPNINPYRHGVLWCILKMWACQGNFNGSVLYKKYLIRTLSNFVLSVGLLVPAIICGKPFILGWNDIPEEMDCIIPTKGQQIQATCILPTVGDVYIPLIIAILFLAINTAISFWVIVTVFIRPNTSSIGYNFLSYIFDDALGYSLLWQRPNKNPLQKEMMKASVDQSLPVTIECLLKDKKDK
ncbi:Oidioi.mRNA.OKI2018_I69.PAR.g9578.t1.cds [Oikopleura dioica]|uniref:Oidioi.mRNA.OKI2018_I69.PAR.g9578.t1.cds n=1 Tax=Oikopleura dioica TaxID=34765 RepID=A0ABN7RTZ2_OIKDI|nr:Oidioi.mRNA.OKI2018_I69.PAR.g9578.t1.cds [Oikopleura dioica]